MDGDPSSKQKGLLWRWAFLLKCVAPFVAWRPHEGTPAGDLVRVARANPEGFVALPLTATARSVA